MSAPDLQSQLQIVFLLSKERIPRAFSDDNLKLMLFEEKIVSKGEKLNSFFGYERDGSGKMKSYELQQLHIKKRENKNNNQTRTD